jgi:superfamily II DNA or RNA helicase
MKIEIYKENPEFLQVKQYTDEEIKQLEILLTKRIQNWRFHPLVKKGHWDGYFQFLDKSYRFPIGLWKYVYQGMKEWGYDVQYIDSQNFFYKLDKAQFVQWVNEWFSESPKKPRDYQIDAAYDIICAKRSLSEIATSAGKTLIIFIVFMYLNQNGVKNFLMIVPNTSLILQTVENFEEYNVKGIEYKTKTYYSESSDKGVDADFVIGTFQSLTKLNQDKLAGFRAICVDEAHYSNSKSIKNIISKCKNAIWRFGVSGTLGLNDSADSLTMQSYLGPNINQITSDFLIQNGYATKIVIKQIYLSYLEKDIRENLRQLKYSNSLEGSKLFDIEKKLLRESEKRLYWITSHIAKVTKNSLVLFQDIKGEYGKKIYRILKEKKPDFKIIYIDGGVSTSDRDKYINQMENENNVIVVASTKVFGTGISINNIHSIFFAESYKSEKIVRQSIGRGMRLLEGKTQVNIFDYVDDFSTDRYKNILLKHGEEREATYIEQKFEYQKFKINL